MKITQPDRNVLDINFTGASKQEYSIIAMADIHFDSCKCDVQLFEKHLQMAHDNNSVVLIAGDMFDAMQGHDDPRRSLNELKAEYKCDNYLDALVLDVAKTLLKYKVTYIIGMGNHESSVERKSNTNLIQRLCHELNTSGGHAYSMGYWGFLRVTVGYTKGNASSQKAIYFHHGSGAGAPVTKGVIETARQAVYLPDADLVINGHNHQSYALPLAKISLSKMGVPVETVQWFVRTPGYKKHGLIAGDRSGFDIEKHPAPTPRGCVKIDLAFDKQVGLTITPITLLY
jgi:hypothetical protein